MLAVKRSEKTPTCAVNVLPCRIQHNGPVHASTRHWTPEITSDGNQNSTATAYFRGRKLNGRVLDLPEGYRGAILQKTDTILPNTTSTAPTTLDPEEQQEEEPAPETKVLQEVATFDKITVYGHEVQPDAQEDVYIKGINEWIGLAGAMNSF
ncbi:ribonuclease H1 small subunit, partial [Aureobasidium melanogenum]